MDLQKDNTTEQKITNIFNITKNIFFNITTTLPPSKVSVELFTSEVKVIYNSLFVPSYSTAAAVHASTNASLISVSATNASLTSVSATDATKLAQNVDATSFAIFLFSLGIFWLPSIIINVLVCVVIHRSRRLQSTTNYFVISLSVSDLLVSTVYLPLFIVMQPYFSNLLTTSTCKCLALVEHILPATVFFIFTSISIDRFYTIIYPLSFKVTRGRAKQMICISWVISCVVAFPFAYFYDVFNFDNDTANSGGRICGGQKSGKDNEWTVTIFAMINFVAVYLSPALIMVYSYTHVFRYIWRIDGRWKFQRTTHAVTPAKASMVKLIISVTLICLILIIPFGVLQLVRDVTSTFTVSAFKTDALWTVVWFYHASAAVKPALYLVGNSNFRRGCREVMCCWSTRCYRRSAYAITKASIFSRGNHIGVVDASNGTATAGDSPTRVFNRASKLMTSNWPLSAKDGTSSTYI